MGCWWVGGCGCGCVWFCVVCCVLWMCGCTLLRVLVHMPTDKPALHHTRHRCRARTRSLIDDTRSLAPCTMCSQCNDKCENQHTIDRTNKHVEQHNMHKHKHHRANTQVQLELNLGARSVAVVCVHCGMFKLFVCSVYGLMVIGLVVAL